MCYNRSDLFGDWKRNLIKIDEKIKNRNRNSAETL